ncbi:MAG TPA: gamma carbonic anhydrase family protein [Rubrobacter sp.]|nr:gamma carbonic anhydrase family protein [Rubrobacter sp.]
MPAYSLGDRTPKIHPKAYVHPSAVIIGDVTIGPEASVWPCAVLRGDYGRIDIGARTSVQDGSVIHATAELSTTVGSDCVIGHLVHLEGCTVEDGCLIGSNSVVLHAVVVRRHAFVAASAVLTGGQEVPSGARAQGVPARIVEGKADIDAIAEGAELYRKMAARYAKELVELPWSPRSRP